MDAKSRNPFYEEPLQKAFYYPSPERNISKKEKRTFLSSPEHSSPVIQKMELQKKNSPETEEFLTGSNQYRVNTVSSPGDDAVSAKLDESWPTSERPSTIGIPGDVVSPVSSDIQWPFLDYIPQKQTKEQSTKESQSTLEKYISRFRYGQPTSREERQKPDEKKDFWWLKPAPVPERSSTPIDDSSPSDKTKHQSSRILLAPYNDKFPIQSKDRLPMSPIDEETRKLQTLADNLIEVSESALSSGPIVSTDGLGSTSPSSAGGGSVDEAPYRPEFTKILPPKVKADKENVANKLSSSSMKSFLQGKYPDLLKRSAAIERKPHDDILQQWRMRRRLEIARQTPPTHNQLSFKPLMVPDPMLLTPKSVGLDNGSSPALKSVPANSDFPPPSEHSEPQPSTSTHAKKTEKYTPQIASPTLTRKPGDQVEPHLHLLCDLVPCPHQQNIAPRIKEKSVEQSQPKQEEDTQKMHETDSNSALAELDKNTDAACDSRQGLQIQLPQEQTQPGEAVELTASPRENLLNYMESNRDNIHPELCKLFLSIVRKDAKHSDEADKNPPAEQKPEKLKHKMKATTQQKLRISESVEDESTTDDQKSDSDLKRMSVRRKDRKKSRKMPVTMPTRKTETVKQTIGQVVSDRLFSFSEDETMELHESTEKPASDRETKDSISPETSTEHQRVVEPDSSGDEFTNDSMLQLLRQQRSTYEQKLRLIDTFLNNASCK
ncbi:uncharacterized protein LOC141907049 [Tubulanus polymorphus]|uniref:uncharacterized protein LOC141907049 n=1 Tax=Tubulanus polymorphus TaxID=672921 RepID=UPI003DA1E359